MTLQPKRQPSKKQALVESDTKYGRLQLVFIVAPQLTTNTILGADFPNKYHVVMDFNDMRFVTVWGRDSHRHSLFYNGVVRRETEERLVSNHDHEVRHSHRMELTDRGRSKQHISVRGTSVTKFLRIDWIPMRII
jgi:hypothetical protein